MTDPCTCRRGVDTGTLVWLTETTCPEHGE